MKTKTKGFLLTASIGLAIAFTFSCSSDDGKGDGSGVSSSSVGGGEDPSSSSNGGQGGGNACTNLEEVPIGSQVWAKKNLDCEIGVSKCYNNDPANCVKYGRLYDWATAMGFDPSCNSASCASQIQTKHQGICPSGWHIPSEAEWNVLVNFAGGEDIAGKNLKAKNGWSDYQGTSGNGTDDYDFLALPGGINCNNSFSEIGQKSKLWAATEFFTVSGDEKTTAYVLNLRSLSNGVGQGADGKSCLFSVRCVKD